MMKRICLCGRDHYGTHNPWARKQTELLLCNCFGWGYKLLNDLPQCYIFISESYERLPCKLCIKTGIIPIPLTEF